MGGAFAVEAISRHTEVIACMQMQRAPSPPVEERRATMQKLMSRRLTLACGITATPDSILTYPGGRPNKLESEVAAECGLGTWLPAIGYDQYTVVRSGKRGAQRCMGQKGAQVNYKTLLCMQPRETRPRARWGLC